MTKLCFDFDAIIFDIVSIAEEKFITATHKPTGKVLELDNVTALWGDFRKKVGGWIGQQNALAGNAYYKAEDFEVVPCQRPRPFRITLEDEEGNPVQATMSPTKGAKKMIDDRVKEICRKLGATEYFGYTGTGDVFRHEKATLLPYKGGRDNALRPLLLKEMKEYVCEKHNSTMVRGIEADDACSMATVAGYKAWKKTKDEADKVIQIAIDKDAKQTEGWHYNPAKDSEPRLIEGFGKLWLTPKGDVDGCGRIWLYWQIAHGDSTDGYATNCHSDKKYAGKGAYSDLKDCTNDKEAWTKLVEIGKRLYPEKRTVTTFRGEIEIDHMYVLQEMATMAFMLRHEGDSLDVRAVCKKLGVDYE